jgi:sporulation protein YlmC with PRC-barrel domain
MLKKLMVTTAIGGLMIGSAFAADDVKSPSPAPAAKSTEMTQPSSSPSPAPAAKSTEMTQPSSSTSTSSAINSASPSASSAKFINSQRQDQYLASKFKGTDVIGADDKKIGDVSDILFDKGGKVEAYVVGVGGFLGIGSKEVALAPTAFQVVPGDKSKNESDKLRLSMTKDQLKEAANFEPYKEPRSTTGTGATTRPLGSPASPAAGPATPPPAAPK